MHSNQIMFSWLKKIDMMSLKKFCLVVILIFSIFQISNGCWWLGNGKGIWRSDRQIRSLDPDGGKYYILWDSDGLVLINRNSGFRVLSKVWVKLKFINYMPYLMIFKISVEKTIRKYLDPSLLFERFLIIQRSMHFNKS